MGFACSQKTDDLKAKKIETDKSLMVEADSAAIAEAKKKAAIETNKLLQGMMPPGMGDLGGMLGR